MIRPDKIYCCQIKDKSLNPNITDEFLNSLEFQFSSYTDFELKHTIHTIYAENRENADAIADEIRKHRFEWRNFEVIITDVETIAINEEDWAEIWKEHFKIQYVSPNIVIKPSWLDYQQKKKEIIVELDPGMSFGTGRHPTSRFCLKMLDRLTENPDIHSFLDAGCGSGILAIAAVKLGFRPVTAFDVDPLAIETALENITRNTIPENSIQLTTASLENFLPDKNHYDLIAANILFPILMKNKQSLVVSIKPGGYLILSGILTKEYQSLREAFTELRLTEEITEIEEEWQSGLFRKFF